MDEDEKIRHMLDDIEVAHTKPSSPKFYVAVIIGGIITGLVAGFLLGSMGTFFYAKLTVDEAAFDFLYGLGPAMLFVGIFGACLGGAIGAMGAHRLAFSRFYKYSHYIIASLLLVIFCTGFLLLYSP